MPPKRKNLYSDNYVDPPRPKPIPSISPEGIPALRYEMFMPLPGAWKSISYNPDENKGYSLFFYNPVTNESQKEYPPPSQMPVQPLSYPQAWYSFGNLPKRHPIKYTEEEYNNEVLRLNEKLVDFDEKPHDNDSEYSDDEGIEAFLRSQNHFPEPAHVPYHRDHRVDPNYSRTHVLAEEARMRLKERGGYPSSQVESEQSEQSGTESNEEENIIFFGDFNEGELYSDFNRRELNGTTP